ncbi:hypothetical protein [Reinekea blandensis]|nr:hypothetical protein [Reinekea blandensis]
MSQQTISTLETASKSETTMIVKSLLALSEQPGAGLTDVEYDALHQAFFNFESKMLKQKRLVRMYPNWVTAEPK